MFRVILMLVAVLYPVLGACNPAAASNDKTHTLQYTDAWIREAPPGMQMMAGYVTIYNPGKQDVIILSAASNRFMDIEMHKTEITNGTARMVEQENLLIPAGGSLELSPGGYHLMLMMPSSPLKMNDKVNINFTMKDKSTDHVEFEVLKAKGNAGKH